jgi:hypothetical protein
MFPKESFQSTNLKSAQEPCGFDSKIEVSFEQGEGAEIVALRYMTWTEGLGWCCQKTIRVGHEQLDELHRALTVARHRARRRAAEACAPHEPAQVIQLPSLA